MFNTVPDTNNTNPIFSSYNVRSADFNENMDEFVKAPNDIYIEEQKKKKPVDTPKKNINKEAIDNIPQYPEWLEKEYEEVYKMPEWYEKLNVCSPDEIEEWKKQGKMGIAEAWEINRKWAAFAPYVNTTKDTSDAITAAVLLDRVKKGQELSYEQQEKLVDYLRDAKKLQTRGFTFGGGAVNGILATIPYMEEFMIGLATSEGGVGLLSLAKTLSSIGAKKAARKAVETALKETAIKSVAPAMAKKALPLSAAKKIYKDTIAKTTMSKALVNVGAKEALKETGKALPAAIGTSAKFGLTKMPHTFMGGIADKQISTGVYVTDLGDTVFTDSENLALSIMKSFGESTFEALTETAGWTFSPVAGYFAKPIQKLMPKKFFTGFEKLVSSRYGMPAAQALRKYGYDGVIEEMGEEVLNRFLCQTFGINGLDEYNFDGFMNNVFYANDPSQWAQEAISFAAVGAGGHIVAGTQSKISDEWKKKQYDKNVAAMAETANKYIQSPEQFYLDQGLIKIKGSQSLAEQKLRDIWTSQNVDEGLQNDVLKNMSETEIRSELKNAIENEVQNETPETAAERIEKDLTKRFVDNKTFAREKDAKSVAALFAAPLQKLSEVTGMSLEEVMQEEMPEIQREAEQAAKENGRYIQTDGRIEDIIKELDELPSDFNDENYINQRLEEINLLNNIKDGDLQEADYEKVKNLINSLDAAGETEFANELRELAYEQTGQLFQSAASAGAEDNIEAAKKEWEEKGTDSKYFKKWFGDSKVVDENGKPLIVYHGTNADFEKFEIGDIGYHFGNIEQATERMTDFSDGNPHIMSGYLRMENPLDIVSDVGDWLDVDAVKEYLHEYEILNDEEFNNINTLSQITSLLQNKGYDGVIYENQFEGKGKSYIVFNSSQFKAVDNQGTFDENNPNIYYQRKQYNNPDQMKFNFDDIVETQAEQQKLIFQPQTNSGQNVQENIKKSYSKEDIKKEKIENTNNNEIVDTGDALLGNLKKNKKQYSWDELDNMNDLLRKKYLSKSYIYELPSADDLRKENLSDRTIAYIYFVHSKINAKPAKGFDEKKEHQKIYFDGVHEVMSKTIDFAKKNNDLITNYSRNSERNKELFNAIFPDYDNKKPYNVFTAYPDLNRKAIIVGGNKLVDALYLGYGTETNINNALALVNKEKDNKTQAKSDLEGWEKKFTVAETYRGWCVADRKSGVIISGRDLPSKEIAEKIAKQMYEYLQKKNTSFTVGYKDLRNYIPRRENNQNVKPEALIEVFGFRGINFGNWTKQSERQDFLNLAYDSLYDLAELLNLPPKALSLDGKLGLAFGAQGRSKAAGHFIPEYNEINLTRKSGAGALAHEWWHALDYYFGDLSLNKDFSGRSALGNSDQGELRPEIFNALKSLELNIKYTPLTEKEIAEKSSAIEKGARRNIEYYANDIKRAFAKSKNADKIAALVDDIVKNADTIDTKNDEKLREKYFNLLDERRRTWDNLGKLNNLEYQCRKLQQVKELAAASKKYSKYYENAKLLNTYEKGMGSGYWTSNTELGARAFASYILDKMTKQKFDNGFLVRDEKGEVSFNLEVIAKKLEAKEKGEKYEGDESSIIEWYPAEPEERKRIFDAFDKLFNAIQYEKTDRGYKLYQGAANTNYREQLEDVKANLGYKKFVNRVVNKKLSKKEKSQSYQIGRTPAKLVEAGFPQNNISVGYKIIEKAQDNRNPDHNLSETTISEVYQALRNPIAVIKAEQNKNEKTPNNRYSVVLDLQEDEHYVLAAFEVDKKDGNVTLNDIRSIHSRENYTPLIDKAFNDGRLIKVDRAKIKDLLTPEIQPDIISGGVASLIDKIYQGKNNVKFYQAAYHGTPHDFENFSIENIGSGEGAQAHGWGLYFAEDKNISERYRRELTGETFENKKYYYNGKLIEDARKRAILSTIVEYGKKRVIENREDFLARYTYLSKEERAQKEKELKYIKNLDESKIKETSDKRGQVFKVDVPDYDVLLDEDLEFAEQPQKVQEALTKIKNELIDAVINKTDLSKKDKQKAKTLFKKAMQYNSEKPLEVADSWKELKSLVGENVSKDLIFASLKDSLYLENNSIKGRSLYRNLATALGSKKAASEKLNEYGIKGITYDGFEDGRCYVVFDDKAVKVLEKYYQEEDPYQENLFFDNKTPRKLRNTFIKGAFVPAENLIELFKNSDESTIIHEFAHWWLSRLEKYAQYNDELALDLEEVRKFVKNDGSKFTREQHEKFAVGFEAYIRNGSARSNRLKKIFEDFKNALIRIYDSIKQLVYVEDGRQYSFSEEDVENLNKLFERLLTTENERIRKTVFDRCDDINDRIKEIKANQENEMKELDELWRDNIAINNRKAEEKLKHLKAKEYLEMAENASYVLPKEVKKMQERYKHFTFQILELATGYKRQFIANPKNWEKVEDKIENIKDPFSSEEGFVAEWSEFYTDTGVSYDNGEIDGDYNLARQAFDVMVDGSYILGDMVVDDISEFYGKFDFLEKKMKSLKGEQKKYALEAMYMLFDKIPAMPDEVVEDIIRRLGEANDSYEEGQKEDFNRKNYPNIPVVQQLQFYVTRKLDELKIYDPNVRYKVRLSKSHSLYKAIKYATSVNSTKRIVRQINDYVISDLENQAKAILNKEIQKQIKVNSKLVKIGTLKKGKFDWQTNTVFAELAELNKLKQKEALAQYGMMIELDKVAAGEERDDNDENPLSTPEFKTDFQSNLRRKFLEYKSNRIKDLNLLATRSLLEDIMTLKFEGRRAKDAEELEKRLQKDDMKTDLAQKVKAIKDNDAAKAVAKFIMGETPVTSERTLANWETSLNALFGKEVAQRYSLLKLESDAEVYAYKHYSEFCQKAMDIYGLNNPINAKEKFMDKFNRFVDYGNIQPLVKLMQEYEEEVYNFKETTFSKETGQYIETGVLLSRAEIITLYAWSMNEELEGRIITQYGVYQTQYMFDEILSDEDKQFAWLLIDTCEAMYDDNNEVFIRTMGLSLPKVQNYFPSKTVRVGSEIDMLHENVVRSSNPSFIKERKTCNRIKMKPEQPISILLPHINKTARYVILSERMNYLNAIFKDGTVRAAIKEVFDGVEIPYSLSGEKVEGKRNKQKRTVGDRIHDTLLNQLGSSTFENYVRGLNVGKTWADAIAANYITSRIGGNAKVMFGQLTSVINYAEKMPLGLWSKGFAEALKKPKETFKYMMDNCDYLKARLAGNSMNEVMSKITDEADRFRTLRNFCATNTKYGDILAIIFGGKPYIDYLVSQGMNEGDAFDKFVEDTLRAQQSGHNSATSVWQKKMSENFFTRMMFAFNNTSLQYERKFLDAIAARTRGDIDNKEFIKAILIYKVFNPIIFTSFLGNLSLMQLIGSLLRGDDDDNALARFGIDAASAMVFSNMGAYGFAGMGISTLLQFLKTLLDKNEYKPFLKTVPIIGDVEEIGKELILKNEVTFADWVDAMSLIGDDATGVPVSRLTNTAGGVGDMAQGEYGVGLLRMLGYGNYRANVAATGHPPEKKKRNKK